VIVRRLLFAAYFLEVGLLLAPSVARADAAALWCLVGA
jgi:hypothetical protein